jgi:predicted dehydrogenase
MYRASTFRFATRRTQIDHIATSIIEDRKPRTPGDEGVQDHVVMEAIYESARFGGAH